MSNDKKRKPYMDLPTVAKQMCFLFDGVVLGSSAEKLYKGYPLGPLDDIDIVIPFDQWTKACKIIPGNAKVNSFGGFKFEDGGISVDVWMDDVTRVLFMSPWKGKNGYLWSPKYGGAIRWDP